MVRTPTSDAVLPPRPAPDSRILLAGSSGGHLAQLLSLREWWADSDHRWVTFDTPDARSALRGETVAWASHPTTRNLPNLLRNTRQAQRLMRDYRPTIIVSTGAGVALPYFMLGRFQNALTVYIEVYDRVETSTLTGRLCRPFTSLMLVQWPEQKSLYRGSHVIGPLL